MSKHIYIDRASTSSTDEFESVVGPVTGPLRITPKYRNTFNTNLSISRLNRIGMLLIDTDPMQAIIEPRHNTYVLTVPLVNSCHIKDANTRREFSRKTAHILYPDRVLDSLQKSTCQLLGVTFLIDKLDEIAEKILGNTDAFQPLDDCSLSLTTPSGINLAHNLTYVCGELNRGGATIDSDLSVMEMEDNLITALLLAMDENQHYSVQQRIGNVTKCHIALAEDYLFANLTSPVSRDRLAEISGVSIRSLSRAFVKRHGVGPMRFLKERRMEAVRMELINARPENTKVSDVALHYGFTELGKFSLLYKSIYNEKPSETLKH